MMRLDYFYNTEGENFRFYQIPALLLEEEGYRGISDTAKILYGVLLSRLALSRKKDEAVIINDDIEITIIEIKGDQVKIGISAPKSVPIYRKEVYMQIQNANKEAAQSVDIKNIKELFAKK